MIAEAIVIMGPPGSGKGTVGERIAREGRIPYICMSDEIRAELRVNPELKALAEKLMAVRKLLPDHETNRIWTNSIRSLRGYSDIVLDGYPRTPVQFEVMRSVLLEMGITPVVAVLMARYETTNQRRLNRIEEKIRRGETPRPDDMKEEIHRVGFDTYQRELRGIQECMRKYHTAHHYVNAERDPESVYQEVVSHFHLPNINVKLDSGELVVR